MFEKLLKKDFKNSHFNKAMNFQKMYINSSLALVLLLCLTCACQNKIAQNTPAIRSVPVTVEIIKHADIPVTFEYIGVVQSSHEVEIRARVTGYLDQIAYKEGLFVKKSELLFQLDPRSFQAALEKAQAQVVGEQAVLWQAERAVKRFLPLYEQHAASQRDLDNALAQEMSANAQVLAAQAQLTEAQVNLSYTTIRSPVDGLAAQANYRVGALISPGQDLLTTVSVMDPIWVNFSISEQDVLRSQQDRASGRLLFPPNDNFAVQLILADKSVFPETGRVSFASPTYDSKTGTMMIRVSLPNPDNTLRPGQFVRVKITGALRPNAIVVPQRSVVQSKNGTFVFIVDQENKAQTRLIDPGPWNDNDWIIYGGLNNGDKVIVDGVNKVLPGTPVTIIESAHSESKV